MDKWQYPCDFPGMFVAITGGGNKIITVMTVCNFYCLLPCICVIWSSIFMVYNVAIPKDFIIFCSQCNLNNIFTFFLRILNTLVRIGSGLSLLHFLRQIKYGFAHVRFQCNNERPDPPILWIPNTLNTSQKNNPGMTQ